MLHQNVWNESTQQEIGDSPRFNLCKSDLIHHWTSMDTVCYAKAPSGAGHLKVDCLTTTDQTGQSVIERVYKSEGRDDFFWM